MGSPWITNQWQELCARVKEAAEHYGSQAAQLRDRVAREAEAFTQKEPPDRYPDILDRIRSAAELAKSWRRACQTSEAKSSAASGVQQDEQAASTPIDEAEKSAEHEEELVEDAVDKSFPASDPPGWTKTKI